MGRPLRSTPVTGASSLLRTGPPARPASVLNTSQFLLLGALPLTTPNPAGGGIGTCLPTFHAAAADQDRVAFMPDTVRPVNGHPPDSSRDFVDTPVSMSLFGFSTLQQRFTCVRLPDPSGGRGHLSPRLPRNRA